MHARAAVAFKYNFGVLTSGADLMIPETSVLPVESLPSYDDLPAAVDPSLLEKCCMVKLNGGLGTGMGLEKAKSLLPLKGEGTHEPLSPQAHLCPQPAPSPCAGDDTFLDFIAKQAAHTRTP